MLQSIENRILLGFGLIAVLLGVIGYFAFKNVERINALNKDILSSYEIIAINQELLSLAIDMETGARGYIISGTGEYLQPLQNAVFKYPDRLTVLKQLSRTRPAITADVDSLPALFQRRKEISEDYVRIRQEKGLDSTFAIFGKGMEGKIITDKIRTISQKIGKSESASLRKLLKENYESFGEAAKILTFLIAVIIVTLITVFALFRRDISGRRRAEKQLQELNKDLEQKVEDRTEDLNRSFEDTEAKVKFRNLELEKQNRDLLKRNNELENKN
ncbi:MAG: CHASE3 domain-containing protein [Bacteroidota bacterium]